jgi:hypothetical protein
MGNQHLLLEAADCRKQALIYLGRAEAEFLLGAACEFERLAAEPREPGQMTTRR